MNKFLRHALFILIVSSGMAQGADNGIWAKITANRRYLLGAASLGSSAALYSVARDRGCSNEEVALAAGIGFLVPQMAVDDTVRLNQSIHNYRLRMAGERYCMTTGRYWREIEKIDQDYQKAMQEPYSIVFVGTAVLVPAAIGILCWLKGEKASQPIT